MIDLHTHSFLSDGQLLPEELVRRCEVQGYRMLVISDHVGISNAESIVPMLVKLCASLSETCPVAVLPGAEVTHVRPEHVAQAVAMARQAGARVVLGHGETLVEPVIQGANRALILAGVDVLAHPGLISEADARLAADGNVALEISGRKGHCLANGHVLKMARSTGARLVYGSDGHTVGDYPTRSEAARVALGAGMSEEEVARMFDNAAAIFARARGDG